MKPLQDNLRSVRIEDDATGDLLPILDYAGQRFNALVKAVVETNKGGYLTLKIAVKPSTAGALAIKPKCASFCPRGRRQKRCCGRLLTATSSMKTPSRSSSSCAQRKS